MHIKNIYNIRVGENMNPKSIGPKNSCLMYVGHKNNIKCPPLGLFMLEHHVLKISTTYATCLPWSTRILVLFSCMQIMVAINIKAWVNCKIKVWMCFEWGLNFILLSYSLGTFFKS